MKKILVSLLVFTLIFVSGCGKKTNENTIVNNNDNNLSEEEIKKVTTDAPMTDIEKEVLNGEGGIQDNYAVENIRVENGYLLGTVTNKGTSTKSISISILMMNSESGEQYGVTNVDVDDLDGGASFDFSILLEESAHAADKFDARVNER